MDKNRIKKIILDQSLIKKKKDIIKRELENDIEKNKKSKQILILSGIRRCGKSTLLHKIRSKNKESDYYLNFDDERLIDFKVDDFQKLYEIFLELFGEQKTFYFDEIQNIENWERFVRRIHDDGNKIYITGSNASMLSRELGTHLTGRHVQKKLFPFSFREFLNFKNKTLFNLLDSRFKDIFSQKINFKDFFGEELNSRLRKYFEEYLIFGGYPAVALAKTEKEKIKILESILENYLLKDIKGLLNLNTKEELMKICEFLSTQIGNLLNYQELSNVSNLNYQEVLKHLEILKNTFIIDFLRPFYKNPRTELVKAPKVYFLDNGFRNYLLLDFRKPEKRDDLGKLVENFVFSSLKRQEETKLNYWRTKSKAEVDFVLHKNGEIIPIEVKYSLSPSIGKSFYSFVEKFSPKKGFILTQGFCEIRKIKNTKIYFVPVYYL